MATEHQAHVKCDFPYDDCPNEATIYFVYKGHYYPSCRKHSGNVVESYKEITEEEFLTAKLLES